MTRLTTQPDPEPTMPPITADDLWHAGTRAFKQLMAEMVTVPCTTAGCDGLAYVHPRGLHAEDVDAAGLLCAACLDASIPPDVRVICAARTASMR